MASLSRPGVDINKIGSRSHCVLLSALTYALSPTPHPLITHHTHHTGPTQAYGQRHVSLTFKWLLLYNVGVLFPID